MAGVTALGAAGPLLISAPGSAISPPAFAATASAPVAPWKAYLGNARHWSYNKAATGITTANAGTLQPIWSITGTGGSWASPVVSGGSVYLATLSGELERLDLATGLVRAHTNLGVRPTLTCPGKGIGSTPTIAADPATGKATLYVADALGYLDALDARTLGLKWRTQVVVPSDTQSDYYQWSSPLVSRGRIYLGISSDCDAPLIRGGLASFDQSTGQLLAHYWTVPDGAVGGSIWTTPATDGSHVFVTTGNADESGATPAGDSNSIVALDPATLAVTDKWTVPGITSLDDDFGSSPTIFTTTVSGSSTPVVAACDKNGVFYAFRVGDLSAGPLWQRQVGDAGGSGTGSCLAAGVWDSHGKLFVASNSTSIAGSATPGSVRRVAPGTGRAVWQTPIPGGPVMGTPTVNGAGVLAVGTWNRSSYSSNAVYLLAETTGTILHTVPTGSPVFAQPVFTDRYLLVATSGGTLTAYAPN